jgi:phosphohistidine phosphatase SixA
MRVLLIRHAASAPNGGLSQEGKDQVRALGAQLRRLDVMPDAVYTSGSADADDTAGALELTAEMRSAPGALAPGSGPEWFHELLDELESGDRADTVAIVGNEPRLSLIVAAATGTRHRPLERGEAFSLTADDLQQYHRGRAEVEFRTGLKGEPEALLSEKLHSKTAVATLLAGFTFAALVELLTGGESLSDLQAFATGLLTLSLGLLVACVYVYDQLALPAGFWSATERSVGEEDKTRRARLLRPLEGFGDRIRKRTSRRAAKRRAAFVFEGARRNHGDVYAYMVWAWQWMFTPAVAAGVCGFVLLLVASEKIGLIVGGIVALVLAAILYLALRPRLGTD